jgi:CubicO group peptidase (beta-lactamase class C family)
VSATRWCSNGSWTQDWSSLSAQYAYGGTGYTLLALIVAIVSGQSFADFLKANVFDPLGMKHTVVYDASRPARHKLAQGYWAE